jgi:hypothetical protein
LRVLKPRVHASPDFAPFMFYARARSEFHFFAPYAGPAWRGPARGKSGPRAQKWPARPQNTYTRIAEIVSILCRKRELDLNYFVFARYAPWVPPGAGQKRAAGPKMARSPSKYVYTHRRNCLHFGRMRELDLNYFVFARYGAARRGAKAGRGLKNGPLILKIRIHASPAFSPFLPHAQARSEFICFCSICAPWLPPGAEQKRAAGSKMASSS